MSRDTQGHNDVRGSDSVQQFWIQGRVVIGGNASLNSVQYWTADRRVRRGAAKPRDRNASSERQSLDVSEHIRWHNISNSTEAMEQWLNLP
jgi:hypothetical protein